MVLCWLYVVCPRSVHTCDSIGDNGFCVRFPPLRLRARYLTLTVKISTLDSIFLVLLDGSLVWWDPP